MSRFHKGLMPREGFHADTLGTLLQWTVLNPILTVPAYLAAKYTNPGRELAEKYLSPRAWTVATALTVWGALRAFDKWMDRRVLNNKVTDKYAWQNDEVVVITGGADGIGKEMALMFASLNIKVAVLDIQELTYPAPETLLYIKTDITSPEALTAAHEKIKSHFRASPTVILLNAGVCRGKTILDSTPADVRLTFNVNTIANFHLMREFLPSIVKANHGTICTVASSAAWITAPAMADYAGSKAAALAFHEALAAELVSHYNAPKVRTIVVNQGYTKTALFQGFGVKEGFFAPPLEVATVAEGIVKQILRGESGQIILPSAYTLIGPTWRAMPRWMQHGARIKMANLMAGWSGRQVKEMNLEKE